MTTDDARDVAPADAPPPQIEGWDWADDGSTVVTGGAKEAPYEDLGHAIEQARSQRGWTAQETAKRAGISYKTYLRIEHGEPVRNATLMKLDALLDMEPGTALSAWQRNDVSILEAALSPPAPSSDGQELEDWTNLPPPGITVRLEVIGQLIGGIINSMDDAIGPGRKQRTYYETVVAIFNTLSADQLRAVEHIAEVAKEARTWEKSIGLPEFTVKFEPDSTKYDKVNDPWTEYVNGDFFLKVSQQAAVKTKDEFRKKAGDGPTDTEGSPQDGEH